MTVEYIVNPVIVKLIMPLLRCAFSWYKVSEKYLVRSPEKGTSSYFIDRHFHRRMLEENIHLRLFLINHIINRYSRNGVDPNCVYFVSAYSVLLDLFDDKYEEYAHEKYIEINKYTIKHTRIASWVLFSNLNRLNNKEPVSFSEYEDEESRFKRLTRSAISEMVKNVHVDKMKLTSMFIKNLLSDQEVTEVVGRISTISSRPVLYNEADFDDSYETDSVDEFVMKMINYDYVTDVMEKINMFYYNYKISDNENLFVSFEDGQSVPTSLEKKSSAARKTIETADSLISRISIGVDLISNELKELENHIMTLRNIINASNALDVTNETL